jgi:oligopeptide/dipeptide ABC transporter ATP-binding protein
LAVEEKILLAVKNLKKYFPVKAGVFRKTVGYLKAVDDISFYIKEKETLGLVGESGCGKTTTGLTILRLEEPTAGEVRFAGKNILSLNKKGLKKIRRDMQIIFQDPYSSLNPRMMVADIVGEPLNVHNLVRNKKERNEKVRELLESVGLTAEQMKRYPHEFSGGQRQRIGIARALAVNPKLIIADEPVSALDVSIQAQVINILQDLQRDLGLTYLFIAHDLSVVKHISDRVAVMYLGRIVEIASKKALFSNPLHFYTQSLMSAIPVPNPIYKKKRIILEGDVPSSVNLPAGCRFHPRCPKTMDICREKEPVFKAYDSYGHYVACHLV